MSDEKPPDWDEWEAEVIEGLVPKLTQSAATVSLVPRGETDVKFAVELGLSIMMNKPILAVVHPGTQVSPRLLRVADVVIEADVVTPDGQAAVQEAIRSFLEGLEEEAG